MLIYHMDMKLYESGENYLEAILLLSMENEFVRSVDLANYFNYSMPSISRAVKNLKLSKYISVDTKGYITLTNKGKELAEKIYERHVVLTEHLIKLGVPDEIAKEDACRIEHIISEESFIKIKSSLETK